MTRHLRLECGRPPQFKCGFCDFQSTRKGSINAHIAIKHAAEAEKSPQQQQRYQCSQCSKRFTYKVAMLKHRSECRSNVIVEFSCPKCEFVASRSLDLDTHIASAHYDM
ncbi:transcriptional repressor CTCF-like [Macrosteles quadrilineatus]|uniref:transcriptional repressor CTCF-like n=1 Tax=Macrosteles quadrilineatus TaxID=74068 RepID=UPI0023E10F19|nr:transcriptional repressor CTCF-like [Macrosteles quadrilineatus]